MIFLLNRERVIREAVSMGILLISEKFGIDPDKMRARCELRAGSLHLVFESDMEPAGALEEKYIQQTIGEIWDGLVLPLLKFRLQSINETRGGTLASEEKSATDADAQAGAGAEGPG